MLLIRIEWVVRFLAVRRVTVAPAGVRSRLVVRLARI